MDKGMIEKFSINARIKLREMVSRRMVHYGADPSHPPKEVHDLSGRFIIVLDNGVEISLSKEEMRAREQLIEQISIQGLDQVIESVAYTWFNRIIAIRYMEVNDYLPTHVRVLSSVDPSKKEPDLVTQCLRVDLNNSADKEMLFDLKERAQFDELFRILFLAQCKELNKVLPELFTTTKPYENLLLSISFTDPYGVVNDLINQVPEDDFKDAVQIIGWMYQFYNKELKDDTEKQLKKGVKVGKERLPAKTQLFTPDWIVRYMVENSVGRIWLEGHNDSNLKSSWRYYVDEAEQTPEVQAKLNEIRSSRSSIKPEDIKVIDPCMGSGHILVYAFDVLMQIYESYGYSKSDAAASIVKNNLYGLDIDDRAYQLAYFAVMMKARHYDHSFFDKDVPNNIHSILDSSNISDEILENYGVNLTDLESVTARADIKYILSTFRNAKTFGSLIRLNNNLNWDLIDRFLRGRTATFYFNPALDMQLKDIIEVAKILSSKFDAVITNPPYMSSSAMDSLLLDYVKERYPSSKSDLFACFIERCRDATKAGLYYSMITQNAFMFLTSFENLRLDIISNQSIENLLHLGPHAFDQIGGEVVQTVAFTNIVLSVDLIGNYYRLVSGQCESDKESLFFGSLPFKTPLSRFNKLPSKPFVYWVSDNLIKCFERGKPLSEIASPRQGLATGENARFVRQWFEVGIDKISFNSTSRENAMNSGKKWFPYNKGGEFRKWYGNNDYVVDWENDGSQIRSFVDDKGKLKSRPQNMDYYFLPSITWSKISSGAIAFRYKPHGHIFDVAGTSIFASDDLRAYIHGFCNSIVAFTIANAISPTLNYEVGHIASFPIIIDNSKKEEISYLVQENIDYSQEEWDQYETSWDFKVDPLVSRNQLGQISKCVDDYRAHLKKCIFDGVKRNEERINSLFIDIYGLNDELSPEVSDKAVTIRIPDEYQLVTNLLSYAIGCSFGRYSLDRSGLVFAGGSFDSTVYEMFVPDGNNIIPLNEEGYFKDDLLDYVERFISLVFGQANLESNLKYISSVLDVKGTGTTREKLRSYFMKDFYSNHVKMYQKCPIYWLFDSGKEGAFRALIYMHRYDPELIGRMRQNYVLPLENRYKDQFERETDPLVRNRLAAKIEEIIDYDLALDYYASNPISIDLDDGVKVNYAKFQNLEIKGKNKAIDLLHKI